MSYAITLQIFMIHDCSLDTQKLEILREAMGRPSKSQGPAPEYRWNAISTKAVVYSCGIIAREEDSVSHQHDSDELSLCKQIATQAASCLENQVMVNDEGTHSFHPFYVTANQQGKGAKTITVELIRRIFSNTIYPELDIFIEPLMTDTEWWNIIEDCSFGHTEGMEGGQEAYLSCWHQMMSVLQSSPDIHSPVFVQIGREMVSDIEKNIGSGCVFPRLAIGLTRAGSVAGIITFVTHT